MSLRPIVLAVLLLVGLLPFHNCDNLDVPSGEKGASSAQSDDVVLLSTPSDVTLNVGDTLNLEVYAASKSELSLSYQWSKNGIALIGQNSNL